MSGVAAASYAFFFLSKVSALMRLLLSQTLIKVLYRLIAR